MKHTQTGFWKYFLAYFLICVGTALIVLNAFGSVYFGKPESLVAAIFSIWLGVISLALAKGGQLANKNQAEKK